MKKDIKNIQASVRAKLQNKAKETNRPFAEVLQYFGIERFLYRFSCSEYANIFILKGALMFIVWHVPERRSTLDIDFLARFNNRIKNIEKVIKDICRTEVVPDALVFDPETVKGQRIKEDADYEGVRVKFLGFLDRSRIHMQIDIGFSDITYPRPKLIEALRRTFTNRKTEVPESKKLFAKEIYDEKSDRQTLWKAFLNKGDIKHTPDKLSSVAKEIERFLYKPLDAITKSEKFDDIWKASGPWRYKRSRP